MVSSNKKEDRYIDNLTGNQKPKKVEVKRKVRLHHINEEEYDNELKDFLYAPQRYEHLQE